MLSFFRCKKQVVEEQKSTPVMDMKKVKQSTCFTFNSCSDEHSFHYDFWCDYRRLQSLLCDIEMSPEDSKLFAIIETDLVMRFHDLRNMKHRRSMLIERKNKDPFQSIEFIRNLNKIEKHIKELSDALHEMHKLILQRIENGEKCLALTTSSHHSLPLGKA